jgi:outer membrane beta-barrel protein
MNRKVISTFALALLTASQVAFAQDEEKKEPVEAPPSEETPPPPPSETAAPVEGRKGAPFPRVSDSEETIYAVQRKAYLIDKAFEITPMGSIGFTDRFVFTGAIALSVSWHLSENFALELSGGYMFPNESELTTEILDEGKLTPEIAKLTQMLWAAQLGLQWSPIYGKLQVFGTSLGNFQFYLGAGGGLGQTRVQCTPGMMLDPNRGFDPNICPAPEGEVTGDEPVFVYEPDTLRFMGHLSGGFRFYFANWIGLKIEIVDYLFVSRVFRPQTTEPTQRFTDAVRNNIFLQLGVSFLLGGEEN